MDRSWIKNLASSYFSKSFPGPSLQTTPDISANIHLGKELEQLYFLTHEAVEIFNCHVPADRQIKLLKKSPSDNNSGFILLLNRTQLKLDMIHNHLEVSLIIQSVYQTTSSLLHILIPTINRYGDFSWLMDNNYPMSNEVVVKFLFETLCRAVCENEKRIKSQQE